MLRGIAYLRGEPRKLGDAPQHEGFLSRYQKFVKFLTLRCPRFAGLEGCATIERQNVPKIKIPFRFRTKIRAAAPLGQPL